MVLSIPLINPMAKAAKSKDKNGWMSYFVVAITIRKIITTKANNISIHYIPDLK
jgi:dihydroneopterin aldolase